jgi:excisionase family DNA binding protein
MTVQSKALVSKAEASRVTGLSYSTIQRLVKRGVLREVVVAEGMAPRLRLADVTSLGDEKE